MDFLPVLILSIYALIGILVLLGLIYVIVKRIKDAKKENFEQRDN